MLIARAVADVQARVLLTAFYFVVVPPFALVVKVARDPLGLRLRDGSFWIPRPSHPPSPDAARKQF